MSGNGAEDEVKRRSTYTPPLEDAEFPERLGELTDDDILRAKQASEAAAQVSPDEVIGAKVTGAPSAAADPTPQSTVPPPPTRMSLSDDDIMSKFRDGELPSTESMMGALEAQLSLRQEEETQFAQWETQVRNTLPPEEAGVLIESSRRQFDGLPPLPEPSPVETIEPSEPSEPSEPQIVNPLLASIASDTAEVAAVASPDVLAPDAVPELLSESPEAFSDIVMDPDAVSPPTNSWPLVAEPTEPEPRPFSETPLEPEPDIASVVTDEAPQPVPAPPLADGGVSVGTETVTIDQAVTTTPVPETTTSVAGDKERWFSFDRVGVEPALAANRTSGALQVFWTWWAVSLPLGGILTGAWLVQEGNGFLQSMVAALIGVAVGVIPIVVGTVVGVRWGLPTLVASRAAFGLSGNIVPSVLMLLIRVIVSAFFIWVAVWIASGIYVQANLWRLDRLALEVILATGAVVLVGALVMVGRRFVTLMLWVSAGLSALATAALVVITWSVPTQASLSGGLDSPAALAAGASFVAAILFIFWAHSGADVARFVRPGSGVPASVLAGVAAVIPPLLFIGWGTVVAGSQSVDAGTLLDDPFGVLLPLAPSWYPIPALILLAIPLLGLAALALHSSSYALMSLGVKMTRYIAATIVTVAAAALLFAALLVVGDPTPYLSEVVRFLGVIVAAWVGVFAADIVTRRGTLKASDLLGTTGSLSHWRIAPLVGFAAAIAAGFGVTASGSGLLSWQGYLVAPLSDLGVGDLGQWQLGVFVSLVLAFAVAAFAGIRGGRPVTSDA